MTYAAIPAGAIDTHVHLFDPARFPLGKHTPYAPLPPECGSVADLCAVLDAHGLQGALVVNPTSGYGLDNACMLDALAQQPGRLRGIARVPLDVSRPALKSLAAQGVVGIRVDLVSDGTAQLDDSRFVPLLSRLADFDLILQVQCEKAQPVALLAALRKTPVRSVIDHCGRPDPAAGLRNPGFRALLKLADRENTAVKLSGAFRFSQRPLPYADTDRYVAALLSAFGAQRCMWGSDWPFLRLPHRVDYGPTLATLARWIPDARTRRQVLVGTPHKWFGFPGLSRV
jgi:predicted TIM-barrel fold metal-dependent hydrolase